MASTTEVLMVDSLLGTKILLLKNSSNEAMRTFSENTGMQDELQLTMIWLVEFLIVTKWKAPSFTVSSNGKMETLKLLEKSI